MVPDMFAEQPDPKRRAEQELAYKTLKDCVVELRIATNTIEKMAKMAQQQHEREMLPWDKKMHLEGSLRALAIICMPQAVEPQKRKFRSKFVHLVLGTFFRREMTIEKQGLCNMCCEFMVCVDVQYRALVNVE